MPTLLDISEVRKLVETDLDGPALQLLIDEADAEIIRRFGAHSVDAAGAAVTLTERLSGGDALLFPSRPVSSVTSATETSGGSDTALAANDYRTWFDGRAIQRLATGTNGASAWADEVTLVYAPVSDVGQRKLVAVNLVKIALSYRGLVKGGSDGDHNEYGSVTSSAYASEREAILSALSPPGGAIA